jgi:hypothetical protein
LISVDENGYDFGKRFGFKNKTRNTPLEVTEGLGGVLVYSSLWEDVDPRMSARGVDGRSWEIVGAGCGIGQRTTTEGVVDCRGCFGGQGLHKGLGGEESDCLGHGGLEESSMNRGVVAAVCWEDLAIREEGTEESADAISLVPETVGTAIGSILALETNIITSQTPSMI